MNTLFTDEMTVYNYHCDPETEEESWGRSVVKGVQWRHNKKELSITNGIQTETKVESITIDFMRRYGNKPYLSPNEYRKLSTDDCVKFWTLDAKSGQDVLVQGVSDKELSREYRLKNLQDDFQYVGTITAVSDNRSRPRLKHIKVVAV